MNFIKSINNVRRKILRLLTKGMGRDHTLVEGNNPRPMIEIRRVLICRPNHRLGNLLLITPLVQEVIEYFPNCKIDLFAKGFLGPVVFKNYENVNDFILLPKKHHTELIAYIKGWLKVPIEPYDLVINVISNSSSGRLSAQLANGKYKFFGDKNLNTPSYAEAKHIAKFPVYNLRSYLHSIGYEIHEKPVPFMDLKLSKAELVKGQTIVRSVTGNSEKTISLYTYATGDKCYSKEWWGVLYARLKSEYPGYNIIEILPIENVSQLSFAARSFYSKDVREMGSVIANTEIFLGADSGIMHLASAVHTPTVGFFAVTVKDNYAPYNDKSVAIDTNNTSLDDWMGQISAILGKTHANNSAEFNLRK